MRILLIWPTPHEDVKIILDELQSAGHEIVYWVGEHPVAHLTPKGCIFHDHYDAWDAKPAQAYAKEAFPPPPAKLIASLYETESLMLTMMNKHYDKAPVDERKQIYYDMLGYWGEVLEKVKPDAVVFNDIPHSIYTNIIHDLARMRGIPTLSYEDTLTACRLMWYWDYWKGSEGLRAALERLRNAPVTVGDLGEEMQEYWREHTGDKWRAVPLQVLLLPNTDKGWGLIRHRIRIARGTILTGRFFSLAWEYIRRIAAANLKKEYGCVVKQIDWNVPFVYFPLHFQPERTTSPQGGIYHHQILVAETLAAALPDGWELFIKEHPSQWKLRGKLRYSSARYRGYYERLARIPRVRVVPITTSSFDLTEKSQAVAVVTGTVGWEALLRGKCPLVFGFPWSRDFP